MLNLTLVCRLLWPSKMEAELSLQLDGVVDTFDVDFNWHGLLGLVAINARTAKDPLL